MMKHLVVVSLLLIPNLASAGSVTVTLATGAKTYTGTYDLPDDQAQALMNNFKELHGGREVRDPQMPGKPPTSHKEDLSDAELGQEFMRHAIEPLITQAEQNEQVSHGKSGKKIDRPK